MTLLPAAPRNPVTVPPARLPGSVRRTSTMLMHWPDGPGTDLQVDGRARDLLTPVAGAPAVVSEDTLAVTVGSDRAIRVVSSRPPRQGLDALVGGQGGSRLRSAIESAVPAERQAGTALYLLLDDLAGCTLIAGFAWARWREALMPRDDGSAGSSDANKELGENIIARFHAAARARKMEGICAGFSPGASSLAPGGFLNMELPQNVAPVASVADPEDPIGWHDLPDHPAIAMRRARRIDVTAQGTAVSIDAMFRDSTWDPDGSEVAVHEYHLVASADRLSGELTSVVAEPRVLPYAECPSAAGNAGRMVGSQMSTLRSEVLGRLRGTDCCTHLNDALRSLADVPRLVGFLGS